MLRVMILITAGHRAHRPRHRHRLLPPLSLSLCPLVLIRTLDSPALPAKHPILHPPPLPSQPSPRHLPPLPPLPLRQDMRSRHCIPHMFPGHFSTKFRPCPEHEFRLFGVSRGELLSFGLFGRELRAERCYLGLVCLLSEFEGCVLLCGWLQVSIGLYSSFPVIRPWQRWRRDRG